MDQQPNTQPNPGTSVPPTPQAPQAPPPPQAPVNPGQVQTPGQMPPQPLAPPPGGHKKRWLWIGVGLLIIIGIILFFLLRSSNSSSTNSNDQSASNSSNSTADISFIAPNSQKESCGATGCFNQKFTSCEPATLDGSATATTSVEYTIVGPKDTGCSMTFKYTASPKANWVNQQMTCTFNNKLALKDAVSDVFKNGLAAHSCDGPLVALLQDAGVN